MSEHEHEHGDVPPAIPHTGRNPFGRAVQNDFREVTISPEAERKRWEHDLSTRTQPVLPLATRELIADDYDLGTLPVPDNDCVLVLGDDPERRDLVLVNAGTFTIVVVKRQSGAEFGNALARVGFPLVAGASLAVNHGREMWAYAVGGTSAVSYYQERGARER